MKLRARRKRKRDRSIGRRRGNIESYVREKDKRKMKDERGSKNGGADGK